MSRSLKDLLDLLDIETIEVDLFRGRSPKTSLQRVFGGQVAGQALVAASRTVEAARHVHSLHAYFLRPGDPTAAIVYDVERIRDGSSFSTRRVVARQHGKPIFHLSASFQIVEEGLDYEEAMPAVPPPESLPNRAEYARLKAIDPLIAEFFKEWDSIDLRYVEAAPGKQQVWLKVIEHMPDAPLLHTCALAYASDLTLLGSTLTPHGLSLLTPGLQMASLDHAMWFHRPCRADEWLLYDQSTPSTSGGRGLASGRIFTQAGKLVVSVMQEGLIRLRTTESVSA